MPEASIDLSRLVQRRRPLRVPAPSSEFAVAGIGVCLHGSDGGLADEFSALVGGRAERHAGIRLEATVLLTAGRGWGRLRVQADAPGEPACLAGALAGGAGFVEKGSPLRLGEAREHGPSIVLRAHGCAFRQGPSWRRLVAHYVFLRALQCRQDTLFLHAASLSVGGKGLLLIGPKGAGKTTLATALAARGHGLLGDETAAFEPRSGLLQPMLRPVAVKPGPRSRLVDERLARAGRDRPGDDGIIRVPPQVLSPVRPAPTPLSLVILLDGRADRPSVRPVADSRETLRRLQPLFLSLRAGVGPRPLMGLLRLVASAPCFELRAGEPDATAAALERAAATLC